MSRNEDILQAIINGESLENYRPQSRNEEILKRIALGESLEDIDPQSRMEALLIAVSGQLGSGGSGEGSTDTLQQLIDITGNCEGLCSYTTIDAAFLNKLDTSNVKNMKNMFKESTITNLPILSLQNAENTSAMFYMAKVNDREWLDFIHNIDLSNVKYPNSMFAQIDLRDGSIPADEHVYATFDCSSAETLAYFIGISTSINPDQYAIPFKLHVTLLNTQKVTNFSYLFANQTYLTLENELDLSSCTNMSRAFFCNRKSVESISLKNTQKVKYWTYTFYLCEALHTIKDIDLRSGTDVSYIFNNCYKLTNLEIKNIKVDLQIGSSTTWGHLLTLESLLNACQECINVNTSRTLTVGSANLEKLAPIYVKLTGEAEEDETLPKLPMIQCESTDEGAMTIQEYMAEKGWTLA